MKNEEKIFKEFKRIDKGKENEGYIEWKESVLEEISGYSKDSLINMVKRYEIKRAMLDDKKEVTALQAITVAIPLIVVTLTIVVQCFTSITNNIISARNGLKNNISDPNKYLNDIANGLNSGYAGMLANCTYVVIVILLLLLLAIIFTNIFNRLESKRKIFDNELLLILKEQLATMEIVKPE